MGIFGNAFGWPHLIVILVVILLLFGARKLPDLSKSVAQSFKIFKKEIKSDERSKADSAADLDASGEPTVSAPAESSPKSKL